MSERYQLSRRKTLAGLATIGAAGAGAGLGTSALFSDEESFEDNVITAGTLDMAVTAKVEATNPYWEEEAVGAEVTADGEAITGALEVGDAKPGDWAIICFDITVEDNPGYVQVTVPPESIESNENGYTEPEPEDENGEGELDENLFVTAYDTFTGDDSSPPESYLEGQLAPTNTVGDAADLLADGVPIGVAGDEDTIEFCILLEIPEDVGNEIQSDSVAFDVVFQTEQVRNNENPFSGNETNQT